MWLSVAGLAVCGGWLSKLIRKPGRNAGRRFGQDSPMPDAVIQSVQSQSVYTESFNWSFLF